jgi:sugar lactone lactonase YvrE
MLQRSLAAGLLHRALRLARQTALGLTMTGVLAAAESSAAKAILLAREATAAADAKDYPAYLAKMESAAELRPDFPRILVNLAAAQVANERPEEAVATLERLAALGMNSPVDKSDDFAPLRGRKDFDAVVKKLAANLYPTGEGEIAFTLRDVTGLIEGIAWREKTGEFYFGDVNGRAVWTKNKDGTLKRFTSEKEELLGVFGLAVDEARGTLWAATSAVPGMRGFTPEQDGTAALAEIDLDSGAVRRVIPVVRRPGDQQSHVLGDLALLRDGTVLATDSGGPTIWRLAPGANALEPAVESAEFMSLQGILVLADDSLVVSDYATGLLRISADLREVRELVPPANTTLVGLDGLALAPNGDVIAVQNGLRPNRVLRIAFDAAHENVTGVTVLEAAHLTMAAPSLGCVVNDGYFYFVGNAGWTRFENTDGQPSSPRSVPIFKTKVGEDQAKKK